MSKRSIDALEPNNSEASAFASSVFPTPVGPRNRKEPIGLSVLDRPDLLRRMEFDTAVTAFDWPIRRSCSLLSSFASFSDSFSVNFVTGIPVHLAMISAMSFSVISSRISLCPSCDFSLSNCFSSSGILA